LEEMKRKGNGAFVLGKGQDFSRNRMRPGGHPHRCFWFSSNRGRKKPWERPQMFSFKLVAGAFKFSVSRKKEGGIGEKIGGSLTIVVVDAEKRHEKKVGAVEEGIGGPNIR